MVESKNNAHNSPFPMNRHPFFELQSLRQNLEVSPRTRLRNQAPDVRETELDTLR